MTNNDTAIREFEEKYGIAYRSDNMHADFTAFISEHYVSKEKYDELLQQRDELKDSLVDMVNQFAYRGTYEGRESLHTGGLSALESAFGALGLSDPIALLDFEVAIKNTERSQKTEGGRE